MKRREKLVAMAMVCVGWAALSPAFAQRVQAIPKLDLKQVTGTWYQIVRLPDKAEKHCTSNGIVLYALDWNAKHLQIVNSCQTKDGSPEVHTLGGRRADKKTDDGRLKVGYFPFSSRYWVVAEDPADTWLMVATPNRKSCWILSRTATMPPDTLAAIEARATAEGFNTAKFVTVLQTR